MEPESLLPTAFPEPPAPPPEREPFWGYIDALVFLGTMLPCFLIAFGMLPWLARFDPRAHPWQAIPEQFAFYALLAGVLTAIFHVQYGRALWRSLGFVPSRLPPLWAVVAGVTTAILVSAIGSLIKVPVTENPLTKMLKDPASIVPIAIFGVTIGPLFEELVFRGFLQPLFVRTLGAATGILAAAIPFGILHFWEYGRSWRHVVVLSLAGVAFGCIRHLTGSTRASTLMHAAYNALFFFALFSTRRGH